MLEEATTRKKSSDSIDVAVPYYYAVAGNRQASERKQEPCTTQLRVEEGAKGSTDPPSGICGQCWMYIVVFCLPFQCPYKPILGCAPVEEMWPSLAGAGHGSGQGQSRDCPNSPTSGHTRDSRLDSSGGSGQRAPARESPSSAGTQRRAPSVPPAQLWSRTARPGWSRTRRESGSWPCMSSRTTRAGSRATVS